MENNNTYLESCKRLFLYYKTLGEKAMEQLEEEQLFFAANEDTNSIAVIVQHLVREYAIPLDGIFNLRR